MKKVRKNSSAPDNVPSARPISNEPNGVNNSVQENNNVKAQNNRKRSNTSQRRRYHQANITQTYSSIRNQSSAHPKSHARRNQTHPKTNQPQEVTPTNSNKQKQIDQAKKQL